MEAADPGPGRPSGIIIEAGAGKSRPAAGPASEPAPTYPAASAAVANLEPEALRSLFASCGRRDAPKIAENRHYFLIKVAIAASDAKAGKAAADARDENIYEASTTAQ